jgi:small subunit ribosomal protein S6
MRQYELLVILPLDEENNKKGREKLLEDLSQAGVGIEKTTEMGDRDIAYEIKGARRARYVLFNLKTEPEKIAALDKTFKLNQQLLRYLFVKLDSEKIV